MKNSRSDKGISVFLQLCGLVLLLIGLVGAAYGPLEIYVFYFFSEGGQFHYQGFGFGSLWFAALVVQNLGYYVVAALLIPVGLGHLKLRRWALTLTRLYLWFWLGAGVLLLGYAVALFAASLRLGLATGGALTRAMIALSAALLLLVVLPAVALRLYRSEKVQAAFARRDAHRYWIDRYPFPLLAVLLLLVTIIGVLHLAVFLKSLFPWFGTLLLGRQSVPLITLCILLLGFAIYGLVQLRLWAWWASLLVVSLLTVSTTWSFWGYSVYDIVMLLQPPAYEMDFLSKAPALLELQPVALLALPLVATLALIVYSRRVFKALPAADPADE